MPMVRTSLYQEISGKGNFYSRNMLKNNNLQQLSEFGWILGKTGFQISGFVNIQPDNIQYNHKFSFKFC